MKYVTKITPTSSEFAHQSRFFEWCALNQKLHPVLSSKRLFSINNEEKSGSAIVGMRRKMSGVKAGVADVICLEPMLNNICFEFHGLCLEFKKPGGKQSIEQNTFQREVESGGYFYKVVYSWREAVETLSWYLGIDIPILED